MEWCAPYSALWGRSMIDGWIMMCWCCSIAPDTSIHPSIHHHRHHLMSSHTAASPSEQHADQRQQPSPSRLRAAPPKDGGGANEDKGLRQQTTTEDGTPQAEAMAIVRKHTCAKGLRQQRQRGTGRTHKRTRHVTASPIHTHPSHHITPPKDGGGWGEGGRGGGVGSGSVLVETSTSPGRPRM